ncbi:permease prefix domain 1-containing protein [Paenibacillus spongiae]|uniref:Permease prefix domain 1-containing protein n=1 Tax=Paenibacillus spongiae TaxID=2909671 RepID=A0ABY5S442_9BACL|nr:permease prefix domain 1-containing protein [Paenibacillus spongiae]UVI28674.1 permease prefix domain 1-containing protein [Paenibacillus spongiae]
MKTDGLSSYAENELIRYSNGICSRMKGTSEEVEDFREEMLIHLRTSVMELLHEGMPEEVAVRLALERFGEPSDVEQELARLNKLKRVFSNNMLVASITLLITGTLLTAFVPLWNEILHYRSVKSVFAEVDTHMGNKDHPITAEMEAAVAKQVNRKWDIQAANLAVIDNGEAVSRIDYVYPDSYRDETVKNNGFSYKERWFVYHPSSGTAVKIPGTDKSVSIELSSTLLSDTAFMAGLSLLFGYWLLFAIWGSLNAYHSRNGHPFWVAAFLLFNVFGYLLYRVLTSNRLQRRLRTA